MNKVILIGNLTRDLELTYLQNGTALGKSAIAVAKKYKVNGESREEVLFTDLTFWGKTAEIVNQYTQKGFKIAVEGELKLSRWQDRNGFDRQAHSVSVNSISLLPNKEMLNQRGQNYQATPKQAPQQAQPNQNVGYPQQQAQQEVEVIDEEIPF